MLELKYHDDIDICIIKMVIPYSGILKYLIHTFSNSLQRGHFPDNMKIARVIPILTNYDAQEISNYRPVSVLTQFSKILESMFIVDQCLS